MIHLRYLGSVELAVLRYSTCRYVFRGYSKKLRYGAKPSTKILLERAESVGGKGRICEEWVGRQWLERSHHHIFQIQVAKSYSKGPETVLLIAVLARALVASD